jgi:hypothetical protein
MAMAYEIILIRRRRQRRVPVYGWISCYFVGARANQVKMPRPHIDRDRWRRTMLLDRVVGACYGRKRGGSAHDRGPAVGFCVAFC